MPVHHVAASKSKSKSEQSQKGKGKKADLKSKKQQQQRRRDRQLSDTRGVESPADSVCTVRFFEPLLGDADVGAAGDTEPQQPVDGAQNIAHEHLRSVQTNLKSGGAGICSILY